MTEHRDRRSEDRDIKELFEAKIEVLDARYKNIGLQNEKLDAKLEKIFETYDARLRRVESFMHGQDGNKGALLRLQETEKDVNRLTGTVFRSATGDAGLLEDVTGMKMERKKRDHYWAIMGGGASAFVLWLLSHFGETAWQLASARWKPEAPKIVQQQHPRRHVARYHTARPLPAPQEAEEVQEAPAEPTPEPDQRPHAPLNPY